MKDFEKQKIKTNPKGINKHLELLEQTSEIEYIWIKQVIVSVSVLMGLIISIKSESSNTSLEHFAFISTVVLGGLCILCGLIFLYEGVDNKYRLTQKHAEHIESHDSYEGTLIQIAPRKIFGILRVCFFLLLFSTVISLMVYAIVSDKPKTESNKIESNGK